MRRSLAQAAVSSSSSKRCRRVGLIVAVVNHEIAITTRQEHLKTGVVRPLVHKPTRGELCQGVATSE
jgi:hypothetical protein